MKRALDFFNLIFFQLVSFDFDTIFWLLLVPFWLFPAYFHRYLSILRQNLTKKVKNWANIYDILVCIITLWRSCMYHQRTTRTASHIFIWDSAPDWLFIDLLANQILRNKWASPNNLWPLLSFDLLVNLFMNYLNFNITKFNVLGVEL